MVGYLCAGSELLYVRYASGHYKVLPMSVRPVSHYSSCFAIKYGYREALVKQADCLADRKAYMLRLIADVGHGREHLTSPIS